MKNIQLNPLHLLLTARWEVCEISKVWATYCFHLQCSQLGSLDYLSLEAQHCSFAWQRAFHFRDIQCCGTGAVVPGLELLWLVLEGGETSDSTGSLQVIMITLPLLTEARISLRKGLSSLPQMLLMNRQTWICSPWLNERINRYLFLGKLIQQICSRLASLAQSGMQIFIGSNVVQI